MSQAALMFYACWATAFVIIIWAGRRISGKLSILEIFGGIVAGFLWPLTLVVFFVYSAHDEDGWLTRKRW